MRFARQYAFALVISGVIILIYEAAVLFRPAITPWFFHLLILIFISFLVTLFDRFLRREMNLNSRKLNEMKETQLRLGKTARILLNASGSTYILVNASDFRIIDINRAGTLLFGTSLEKLKGADALTLFSSISSLVPLKMKEAVRDARTLRFQEEAGGKYYYDQVYPLKDESGDVKRVAVFIEDITEIHQIKELTALNQELSELNKTKDRLFSVIGHDLKSPLAGIMNLSGLLSRNFRTYGDEKTEAYLKSIYNTSEQILILLENLLVWAKSRRGQLDYLPEHIVLNRIIPEVSDVFRPSAENKNIQIINKVTDDIVCYADRNMLKSILRNLVQNSIKFTNPGGWVSIDASGKSGFTEISVEDNGVGFPEGTDMLALAGSNHSTEGTVNEKGTGLGLLLCREFIEKHNGLISIKSEKNKGSRITICLPGEMTKSGVFTR